MIYLVAGFALLFLLWLLGRAFVAANPATLAQGARWTAVGLGGLVAGYFALTGRFGPALLIATALVPGAFAGSPLLHHLRGLWGPSSGQSSDVETDWLRMSLDHDSGEMRGTVLQGEHRGRQLHELPKDALVALWLQLRAEDEPSAQLLESWLDRAHPDWREAQASTAPPRRGAARMSTEEALEVLGLEPGADEAAIRDAYHGLMMKLHPDHGGSTWLAARLNEARDVLLKSRR